jgi:hypothetical protein
MSSDRSQFFVTDFPLFLLRARRQELCRKGGQPRCFFAFCEENTEPTGSQSFGEDPIVIAVGSCGPNQGALTGLPSLRSFASLRLCVKRLSAVMTGDAIAQEIVDDA